MKETLSEEGTLRQRWERMREGQAHCKRRRVKLRKDELNCIEEEAALLSEEIILLKEIDKKEKEMKEEI